jgi:hypothetical protein
MALNGLEPDVSKMGKQEPMPDFWPTSVDYQDAIQNAHLNCADSELRAATPACNALGLPVACSGNFADVYHLVSSNGNSWAVKCFTRRTSGLRERYQAISAHLSRAALPFTVEFAYLPEGIRIRGEWFPVLKMDWVEGQTLQEFVQRHHADRNYIGRLLAIWLKVEPALRLTQTTHGDLQHGNVLLVPGKTRGTLSLKLIDYDGLWTPTLAAIPSGEAGHAAYQHPRRAPLGLYSADVDRYPHLVIAAALKCLTHPDGARFWRTYNTGDNLLFSARDFAAPATSPLLRELWDSGDDELQAWAGLISTAALSPLEATPLLEKRLVEGRLQSLTAEERDAAQQILGAPQPRSATRPAEWWNDPALIADDEPVVKVNIVPQVVATAPSTRDADSAAAPVAEPSLRLTWVADRRLHFVAAGAAAVALIVGAAASFLRAPSEPAGQANETLSEARSTRTVNYDSDSTAADVQHTPVVTAIVEDPATEARAKNDIADEPPDRSALTGAKSSLIAVDALMGHKSSVRSVALASDGATLASGDYEGTVKLWDVATGAELRTLTGHNVSVESVAFASDGATLASGGLDGTIRIWRVATGAGLRTLAGHEMSVESISFAPDGTILVSGDLEGTIRFWDVATGVKLRTLAGHEVSVESVAFSPDGTTLASGDLEGTIKFWDIATGTERRSVTGFKTAVESVAFAPDGATLASGGLDGTIKFWDVATGAERRTLTGSKISVDSVAFLADGSILASGGDDVTIRLWKPELNATSPTTEAKASAAARLPFELFIIPTKIGRFLAIDPEQTIQAHGVPATAAELQAIGRVGGGTLQSGEYHLFRLPNRGPTEVRWTGGTTQEPWRMYLRHWQGTAFRGPTGVNSRPIAGRRLTITRPSDEPWLYFLVNAAGDSGQVVTDAFTATLTPADPISTTAP